MDHTQKERLLDSCQMILNADNNVIEILRNNCVAQINTIERNSKSIKDPDPLISTLANISLKYPITIDKERGFRMSIPSSLLMGKDDTRKYNRVPCKMETLNWFIENDMNITDATKAVVNGMMNHTSKRLEVINNMRWSSLTFKVGNVEIVRKRVATNPMDIKIPRDFKNPLMAKVLGIENYIEYTEVPQHMLDHVNEIISSNNYLPYRSIPNIIHFLSSQLDEKYRFLPVISGMNESFLYVAHVLIQPRYLAMEIGEFIDTTHRRNDLISQVCINLLHYGQQHSFIYFKSVCQTIFVSNIPFMNYLDDTHENKFIKSVKGILGKEVSSSVEIGRCIFNPVLTSLFNEIGRNKDGTKYTIMRGEEAVYFSHRGIRGYFMHNAEYLREIKINACTFNDIKVVLPCIATFCCMRFNQFRGKTMTSLHLTSLRYWSDNIHEIVGVTRRQWLDALVTDILTEDFRIGVLITTNNIDYRESVKSELILEGNELYTKTRQLFMTIPRVKEFASWDQQVSTEHPGLLKYHHPRICLTMMLRKLQMETTTILENVHAERWFGSTDILEAHIIPRLRVGVAKRFRAMCRQIIRQVRPNCMLLTTCYFFTGCSKPIPERAHEIRSFHFGGYEVHDDLSKGDLIYKILDNKKDGIYLRDKLIITERKTSDDSGFHYTGIIKDFELRSVRVLPRNSNYKAFLWLKVNSEKIKDGEVYYTSLGGNNYQAVKNSNFQLAINNTMRRHMIIEKEEEVTFEMKNWLLKRKMAETESVFDPTEAVNKRRKLDIESSTS